MHTKQTALLTQVHAYVEEYVRHISSGACASGIDATANLREIIAELEQVQTHPDQAATVTAATRHIGRQLAQLRIACAEPHQHHAPSASKRTLGQALHDYFNSEIDYLARAGGAARREQTNLLLSEVIADLKALALHPTDDQALMLAADLEAKREQLRKTQRPWQQTSNGTDNTEGDATRWRKQ